MCSLSSSFVRHRRDFAKVKSIINMPNLIDIQKKSYAEFLQMDVDPAKREDKGLQGVFKSVFPVQDFDSTASVEFVNYVLDEPKFNVVECRSKGLTFAAPVKIMIRLLVWDIDPQTNVKSIRGFKEQEVYFGEIPLMTENGTFVINGAERVVVSQLHRSPGVFFDHDKGKTLASGKLLYSARIIPYRGSWLDFEFDTKDIIYCRIDRRRKMPVTVLLKSLGYSPEELLDLFYEKETITIKKNEYLRKVDLNRLRGQKASVDIIDPKKGTVIVKRNRKITPLHIRQLKNIGIEALPLSEEELFTKVIAEDIIDLQTGEVLFPVKTEINETILDEIKQRKIKEVKVLFIDDLNYDSSFLNTLNADKTQSSDEALLEIYRRLRPGDPPTLENAKTLFQNLFFEKERYDLSAVGRLKLNEKLNLEFDIDHSTLTKDDIVQSIKVLLDVRSGKTKIDDIDHLGNRRVRVVGELVENQYRIGLTRIERTIKERLQLQDVDSLMPHDLVNAKPVTAVIKEFFGSSQLSQFMDQTNPLAEVYHKRRLSALGPGGLSRERAGFEVRDVHSTHYGRICPIETPEGPNIGLIVSLASYARVNEYGFIETPYRKIDGMKPTKDVSYYSSSDEWKDHVIGQTQLANSIKDGSLKKGDITNARCTGETGIYNVEEIDLMDVASNQAVSVAASLIPFLQNDDAHRALMGANMQRQGLPLLKTRAPLIGTGIERKVASDSGVTVVSRRSGTVIKVDSERIIIKANDSIKDKYEVASDVDIYPLVKFQRSNVDTCINQKPIVKVGDLVEKDDIIADGFATEMGELALGQNLTVAFVSWKGYNYEDGIIVSEKVVQDDLYTSVYIQELECVSRDTKLGREEITSDIPNVSEESLNNLDEAGVVYVGTEVKSGDILVGKLTPKAETQLTPEEKLLRAIFGEKAADVRDTSLRVPAGVSGTVIGAKVFTREGSDPDSRQQEIQELEIKKLRKDEDDRIEIMRQSALEKLQDTISGEALAISLSYRQSGKDVSLKSGQKLNSESFDGMSIQNVLELEVVNSKKNEILSKIKKSLKEKIKLVKEMTESLIARVKRGDELPPGVVKMVKVYVAVKRRLQVGDKLAGRHGNKGVISKIAPVEDMPFLEDGTPVDIVLSPLGVPSRMNIGQIMETHFGWAAKGIGQKIEEMYNKAYPRKEIEEFLLKIWSDDKIVNFIKQTSDKELFEFASKYFDGITLSNPVFDGATEKEILNYLKLSNLDTSGQVELYDGFTGEKFDRKVTVGVMYVLRLHHLVDEKIHARSIGPYSLVTQQPLGGKAQFGGQRLGEMEVWAMEAYGAAYSLQEFLTVKSDDIVGRTKMYEAIVKGENMMLPGLPESFNVLVKEIQSLALDVQLVKDNEQLSIEEIQKSTTQDDNA